MIRAGGKAHWLSDEALIDDQMMSEYIPGDMAKLRELAKPWGHMEAQKGESLDGVEKEEGN
jgi:hypothetical protein